MLGRGGDASGAEFAAPVRAAPDIGTRAANPEKKTMRDQRRILSILPTILLFTGWTACASDSPPELPPGDAPTAAATSPAGTDYRASGNEPFWDIIISDDSMQFTLLGGDTLRAERPEAELRDGGWHFDATDRDRPFAIRIVTPGLKEG